jgi:predicted CopG family antitoxin
MSKTIRVSDDNYDRLKKTDDIPDRAVSILFGAQNDAITKVINKTLEEMRAIVREELEKVRG